MVETFIRERKYLHGVSKATEQWYRSSFKCFEGALDSKAQIVQRISELQQKNSNLSINTYIRCINAYFMWLHKEHGRERLKIPKLREEHKILATLQPEHISRLIRSKFTNQFGHNSTNLRRTHLVALTILDTGLRASEVLGLKISCVNFDGLTFTVRGKGNRHRVVPFSNELRRLLYKFINKKGNSEEYAFASRSEQTFCWLFGFGDASRIAIHIPVGRPPFSSFE
jgi:site-specific recombinase XerD